MSTASDDLATAALRRTISERLELRSRDEVRVIDWILMRLELGAERYGKLLLAADRRDFGQEEREEHLDALVYRACAELMRLDRVHADLRELASLEMVANGLRELRDNAPAVSVEVRFDVADLDDADIGGEGGIT